MEGFSCWPGCQYSWTPAEVVAWGYVYVVRWGRWVNWCNLATQLFRLRVDFLAQPLLRRLGYTVWCLSSSKGADIYPGESAEKASGVAEEMATLFTQRIFYTWLVLDLLTPRTQLNGGTFYMPFCPLSCLRGGKFVKLCEDERFKKNKYSSWQESVKALVLDKRLDSLWRDLR